MMSEKVRGFGSVDSAISISSSSLGIAVVVGSKVQSLPKWKGPKKTLNSFISIWIFLFHKMETRPGDADNDHITPSHP